MNLKLVRLYDHDIIRCANGCGSTWMKAHSEIQTEHGPMVMYYCERGQCNMLTVVARYTED